MLLNNKNNKKLQPPPPPWGAAAVEEEEEKSAAAVAPPAAGAGVGAGVFGPRINKLLPGSLKPSTIKLLQSKSTYNAKETEKLEKQISEAEASQDKLIQANKYMQEIKANVNSLSASEDMKKVNISIEKFKKDYADLTKKISDSCMLEKAKQVEDLHERLITLQERIAEGKGKSKATTTAVAKQVEWLEGAELEAFGEKVGEALIQKPNPVLQAAFDEMLAKISDLMETKEKVIYNVAKLQNIMHPPPPMPQAKSASNVIKCHRKAGGCGNNVKALYKDQPVCFSCFLIHLKEKSQEVIKTVEESDPMFDILADEYERVYPSETVKGKQQADPSKLFELVKQISQEEGVIPMEIDLNSNSGNGEDDEDDEDEEDDSIVVDDEEVSYASSASDEEDEEDDEEEEEEFDNKRNKHGKRERGAPTTTTDALHTIAHRILLARERTPVEARINELFDLHRKASAPGLDKAAKAKLVAAAEVKLDELDALKSVYIIHATFGTRSMVNPFCFYSEEEAEAKCALLEKQTPGLKGRVEEKKL